MQKVVVEIKLVKMTPKEIFEEYKEILVGILESAKEEGLVVTAVENVDGTMAGFAIAISDEPKTRADRSDSLTPEQNRALDAAYARAYLPPGTRG